MSCESPVGWQSKSLLSPRLPVANVLGVGVHAVNMESAVACITGAIAGQQRGYVCVTGVHGVMEAQRDPQFRQALAESMLVVPDGMPTVWIGRLQGHKKMQRVFGPDLMLEVCERSVKLGYTHFFFGGKPRVAEELAATLTQKFPGMKIAGTYTPPFRPLSAIENLELQDHVKRLDPDIVWVGLSTPKQEKFMAESIALLNCRVMIGVGAAFDLHTGKLKDSPLWVKNAGLQWLHRLCQEPSRLWKRYLINNLGFIARITLQLLKVRTYKLADGR